MNNEENDDLWRLLGKARQPAASPFFSRNVLRAIRGETRESVSVFAWLRRHWHLATAAACTLMISSFVLSPGEKQPDQSTMILAEKVSQSADYQVINHLDELLASEKSAVWLEN